MDVVIRSSNSTVNDMTILTSRLINLLDQVLKTRGSQSLFVY